MVPAPAGAAAPRRGRGGAAGVRRRRRAGRRGGSVPAGGRRRTRLATGVNASATGLYRSDDAGASWRKVNNNNPRPMYFSQVTIDPNDPDVVYMGGVDLQMTTDGGKTINTQAASAIHSDHHAIWVDPANSSHVVIGNDGGLAQSWDMAKTWVFVPNLPVGLFYHVSVDMATPFNICGGMQDNYSWCGPSAVRGAAGIANFHWQTIQGGDGFVALQDPKDPRVIYGESQDGNIVRVDRVTNRNDEHPPGGAAGRAAYRWHWDTPHRALPARPVDVYVAGQPCVPRAGSRAHVHADQPGSDDRRGLRPRADRHDGPQRQRHHDRQERRHRRVRHDRRVRRIAEDGRHPLCRHRRRRLQVTKDGGKAWADVYQKLPGAPKGAFVSRIAPSRFDAGTVYATIDDHRQNNYETYIYASKDYGQSWTSLNGNLKGEVIKTSHRGHEEPRRPLRRRRDRPVPLPRSRRHVVAAEVEPADGPHRRDRDPSARQRHGAGDARPRDLDPRPRRADPGVRRGAKNTEAKLFSPPPSSMFRRPARDRNYEFWGNQVFYGENPPQAAVLSYFVKNKPNDLKLKITDAAGREVREITVPAQRLKAGINAACWDLRVQPIPASTFPGAAGGGGGGRGGTQAAPDAEPRRLCGAAAVRWRRRRRVRRRRAAATPGPYVLRGTYNVALVVDGKTVDTKPMRVTGDPEVVLTEPQRKQLYDMAMEMHELQKRTTEAANGLAALNRQITQLATDMASKTDVPADVKAAFESLKTDAAAMTPKLPVAAAGGGRGGGGGGGRGGGDTSVVGKIGQAKNGMQGGMWPNSMTMKAYADSKADAPKALSDANALFARAAAVSTSLAKYNLKLDAPKPVDTGAAARKKTA